MRWPLRQSERVYKSEDIVARAALRQPREVALAGELERLGDATKHVHVVRPGEQRLSGKQLNMDTPNRPEVDGLEVTRRQQHKLRSTIPTRHYVISKFLLFIHAATGKTHICNPERAI